MNKPVPSAADDQNGRFHYDFTTVVLVVVVIVVVGYVTAEFWLPHFGQE